MDSRTDELEAFKVEIDLVAFAQSVGYEIDRRRTSRTSVALRHSTRGDRIIVAVAQDGHFIYASVHDHSDSGSIVDFCQKRSGGSLGHVRKELRPWIGADFAPRGAGQGKARAAHKRLEPVRVDFDSVRSAFDGMSPIVGENAYLTRERGIPMAVYGHERFAGRLRTDARGNVIFPHVQARGQLTGYEIKNVGWTGFTSGGAKRLFCSGFGPEDRQLVICESGIDVLSYAALHGMDARRFVSTAGALNPEQVAILRSAIQKLPEGGEVVLAVDADDGGDVIAEQVAEIHGTVGQGRVAIRRDSPATRGQDWNDVLRKRQRGGPLPHQACKVASHPTAIESATI